MSNNNSNNTSVLNYTEDHKATVKEFSFTGALPDQTAYLATVNELNRFITRFPTLKNVLSANDQQYNRVPAHAKVFAVDVLRDAFVSEPAHSFTMAPSKNADPRAIYNEIEGIYNRDGVSLNELQYRNALSTATDGTMEAHESVVHWMVRMREAHGKLDELDALANNAAANEPWNNQAPSYILLHRRRPTEQETILLMLRQRTGKEPRAAGADPNTLVWLPYPDWFPTDLLDKLNPLMIDANATISGLLHAYLDWSHLNSHRIPQVENVRKSTDQQTPAKGDGKKSHNHQPIRADGQKARCGHEGWRDAARTYPAGHAKVGQCKLADTAEGCPGMKRKQTGKQNKGKRNDRKRKHDDNGDNKDGKQKKVRLTLEGGKVLTYFYCPTFANNNGNCPKSCPLRSVHFRDKNGDYFNPKSVPTIRKASSKLLSNEESRQIINKVKQLTEAATQRIQTQPETETTKAAVNDIIRTTFADLLANEVS